MVSRGRDIFHDPPSGTDGLPWGAKQSGVGNLQIVELPDDLGEGSMPQPHILGGPHAGAQIPVPQVERSTPNSNPTPTSFYPKAYRLSPSSSLLRIPFFCGLETKGIDGTAQLIDGARPPLRYFWTILLTSSDPPVQYKDDWRASSAYPHRPTG